MSPSGAKLVETKAFNTERLSLWQPGRECVWKTNGVWEIDSSGIPRLLKPDHFYRVFGKQVDFDRDYLRPFVNRFAAAMREIVPDSLIFVETEPNCLPPIWGDSDAKRIVSAPHWYDGLVLFMKDFQPWMGVDVVNGKVVLGPARIRKSYKQQLERFKTSARERLGGIPTLIGEIGIPFDMQKKKAYRTGDFRTQVRAMDRSMRVMEDTLLNYTIWNYTSDNSNERGDQWNDEDLSIFSRDQQKDPSDINSGGRALEAVIRPYARATAGEPLRMSFNLHKRAFEFEFRHDPHLTGSTEFFIPAFQYPNGYQVELSDGSYESDPAHQLMIYHHTDRVPIHKVVVKKK